MSQPEQKDATTFAELLDSKFRIPNTNIRFGLDPLIGLIPGVGDWLAGLASLYFLIWAALLGGRPAVLWRMFINILMDVLIGSIPVLGEVFDVYWKANVRNAQILEELRQNPDQATTDSRFWIWVLVIQFLALIIAVLLLITWIITELLTLLF